MRIKLLDRRLALILFFGISSGVPVGLLVFTINTFLGTLYFSKVVIGLLALAHFPYLLKFFFAVLIDNFKIPVFSNNILGHYRGWLIFILLMLITSILGIAFVNPNNFFKLFVFFIVLIAMCSSIQDILMDSYRINILDNKEQGIGVFFSHVGYRLGFVISGAFVLMFADFLCDRLNICSNNWHIAISLSVLPIIFSLILAIFYIEAEFKTKKSSKVLGKSSFIERAKFLKKVFTYKNTYAIIIFIFVFRLNSSFIFSMLSPFFLSKGFSITQIGFVFNFFGTFIIISGTFIGAFIISNFGIKIGLLFAPIMIGCVNLLFILFNTLNTNLLFFYLVIFMDGISNGIALCSINTFIARVAKIYSKNYYHIMVYSSVFAVFGSMGRITSSNIAGIVAEAFGWNTLFVFGAGLSLLVLMHLICYLFFKRQIFNRL